MQMSIRQAVQLCARAAVALAVTGSVIGSASPSPQYRTQFPAYLKPMSPIAPRSMAQCDRLQKEWSSLCGQIGAAHSDCLKSSKAESGPNTGTCSKAACQHLHGTCGEFGDGGQQAISECRAEVQAYERARSPKPDVPSPSQTSGGTGPQIRSGGDQRTATQRSGSRLGGTSAVKPPEAAGGSSGADVVRDLIEQGIDGGIADIERSIDVAADSLSGAKLRAYLRAAEETKAALRALKALVKSSAYAPLLIQLGDSSTRSRAAGEIGVQLLKDLADVGVGKVAEHLFSEWAARVIVGPIAWVTLDVLSPTQLDRDYSEIIRDPRTPLPEKRLALERMFQWADKYGRTWGPGQYKELQELTELVYGRSTGLIRR